MRLTDIDALLDRHRERFRRVLEEIAAEEAGEDPFEFPLDRFQALSEDEKATLVERASILARARSGAESNPVFPAPGAYRGRACQCPLFRTPIFGPSCGRVLTSHDRRPGATRSRWTNTTRTKISETSYGMSEAAAAVRSIRKRSK